MDGVDYVSWSESRMDSTLNITITVNMKSVT